MEGARYITRLDLKPRRPREGYEFELPFLNSLPLEITSPVCFLVGENGMGKSTLLEAVAVNYGFNPEGGSINFNFATRDTHSRLGAYLLVGKRGRPKDGYFLRAESFYNLSSEVERLEEEQPGMFESYGGQSLHRMSHGESFLTLMLHRFRGRGLYLLDEPEAALSPAKQLALLSRMHQLVGQGSQFLIATHAPMLMAYPGAQILLMDETGLHETRYQDTEHYQIIRGFLANPDRILELLFQDERP